MSRFDDPLQLLQEDLKDDDHNIVMASVNRLATIGMAMGQSRCRSELIPWLKEYVENDNDEAHCAIARQLGDFAGLVGGPGTHVSCLLPILEQFMSEEETVIRDAAITSLIKLMPSMLADHRVSQLFPLIKRLSSGDWFTSRCSACRLTVAAYKYCPADMQQQMRSWFINLCRDDTPMVQTAAVKCMADISVEVDTKHLISEMVPLLNEMAAHDVDSLRMWAIDTCASTTATLSAEDWKTYMLPVVEACQDDKSWKVRSRLAEKMPFIVREVKNKLNSVQLVNDSILPLFAALLADDETEVRKDTVAQLVAVATEMKGQSSLVEHLAPSLDSLASDPEPTVRLLFAKTLVPLCTMFPHDAAAKLLVPLMQALANDDAYNVRFAVVGDLSMLVQETGTNSTILQALIPQLLVLAKDPKWRVRMSVVNNAALLAEALGQRVFERKLQPILITSLSDHVSAIRDTATQQAAKIVGIFGAAWATDKFLTPTLAIYNPETNYLHRMTCLLFIGHVAEEKKLSGQEGSCFEGIFMDLLTQAFSDEVANVRLMACQTALKMLNKLSATTITSKVLPAMRSLSTDDDGDVSYFASVCEQAINKSS